MTESTDSTQVPPAQPAPPAPAYAAPAYGAPQHSAPPAVPAYGGAPVPPGAYPAAGPIGKVRSTGLCILLTIVTLGIYPLVWYYSVHEEMKRHTGTGLGGVVGLVLAFFVGFVMPYITSAEVGSLHERAGRAKPVSGVTGLWYFPGMLILVGPLVWFVKTNGALNDYWRSRGATG